VNPRSLNRRIIKFLQVLADDDTLHLRKKTGHPIVVACYGGEKRHFCLSSSPNGNYPKRMISSVNRFVRQLPIENKPTFI